TGTASVTAMARLMYYVSYLLPGGVAALFLASFLVHGLSRVGPFAMIFGLFFSAYVGRYLNRRSRDLEAVLVSTRIRPSDSEDRKFQGDLGALCGAALLFAATAWLVVFGR